MVKARRARQVETHLRQACPEGQSNQPLGRLPHKLPGLGPSLCANLPCAHLACPPLPWHLVLARARRGGGLRASPGRGASRERDPAPRPSELTRDSGRARPPGRQAVFNAGPSSAPWRHRAPLTWSLSQCLVRHADLAFAPGPPIWDSDETLHQADSGVRGPAVTRHLPVRPAGRRPASATSAPRSLRAWAVPGVLARSGAPSRQHAGATGVFCSTGEERFR